MPRACTVCTHAERETIDRALVGGATSRAIAAQHGLSNGAVHRHQTDHLPAAMVKGREAREEAAAVDLMTELNRCFHRINLLFDACDRWLRDADDPSRYDIGPRAEEVQVTYTEAGPDGKPVQRKKPLSDLLEQVEGRGRTIGLVETKYADPRELILKTAARLDSQLQLLGKLLGELKEGATVNVLIAPEWLQVRAVLLSELAPYPEARQAVAAALARTDARN
ncbi:hypothetical protein BH24GEM2_BH24GEM2_17950 [soil metagenome]